MYGTPDMKPDKDTVQRREDPRCEEGIECVTGAAVADGNGGPVDVRQLEDENDGLLLVNRMHRARRVCSPHIPCAGE